MQSSFRTLVTSTLLWVMAIASLVLAHPQSAAAVTCGAGTGVTGWETGFTWRYGVKVDPNVQGMDVNVASPNCIRVGSLYVQTSDINAVEIGWYLDPYPTNCSNGNQTSPHILIDKYYNGTEYCKNGTSTISQGYHGFTIANPDHDNNWDFYVDGGSQGFYNVVFSAGYIRTGAERHSTSDSAYDDFNGLKYQDSSGSWQSWNNTSSTGSNDGGFVYCYYSHLHTASKQTC